MISCFVVVELVANSKTPQDSPCLMTAAQRYQTPKFNSSIQDPKSVTQEKQVLYTRGSLQSRFWMNCLCISINRGSKYEAHYWNRCFQDTQTVIPIFRKFSTFRAGLCLQRLLLLRALLRHAGCPRLPKAWFGGLQVCTELGFGV